MLFHALEMALQNFCTIYFDGEFTIRHVQINRPGCQDDVVVTQAYGRTIEEALALANENYAFIARGIPPLRIERPEMGSLEATGPLDEWLIRGHSGWLTSQREGLIELHLQERGHRLIISKDVSIPDVITRAFDEIKLGTRARMISLPRTPA